MKKHKKVITVIDIRAAVAMLARRREKFIMKDDNEAYELLDILKKQGYNTEFMSIPCPPLSR
jgi:hypothetical protein